MKKRMSFKEWCQILGFAVGMLLVMWLVGYGTWQLFIDTGRAIIH
jgi:hypothetical protein